MRLFSFLLFFEAFNFLVVLVSSLCSPEINDDFITISRSTNSNWRFNLQGYVPFAGTPVITFNSGDEPFDNEIFELQQPIPGVPEYEFRPFVRFNRDMAIEIPAESINTILAPFRINFSITGKNQRFSIIECDACNLNTNSTTWVKYHTSCLIKNLASGFCANGIIPSPAAPNTLFNVTQTECTTASRWDLFGKISPDIRNNTSLPITSGPSTTTNSTSGASTGGISAGGLVGVIFGSIIGTALITLAIGYWFIKDRIQFSKNGQFTENDTVNNQVINH